MDWLQFCILPCPSMHAERGNNSRSTAFAMNCRAHADVVSATGERDLRLTPPPKGYSGSRLGARSPALNNTARTSRPPDR